MDDLISRQAAIDSIWDGTNYDIYTKEVKEHLEELPAADVRKNVRGKWIPHRLISREYIGTILVNVSYDYWFCDTCGYRVEDGQPMYNFCPNCGAKMEVNNESN